MNKKISSIIAFSIIIVITGIAGTVILFFSLNVSKESIFYGMDVEQEIFEINGLSKESYIIPEEHLEKIWIHDIMSRANISFSPNHERFAYIVQGEESNFAVIDGEKQPEYKSIKLKWIEDAGIGVFFSPDSRHFAYVAKKENKEFIVLDGKEHKKYDRVSGLTFSPDSKKLAYFAIEGEKVFFVINEKEYDHYEIFSLYEHEITFSPDSKRVAYTVREEGKEFVVLDAEIQNKYDRVSGLTFSPDSNSFAYRAQEGGEEFILLNGEEQERYDYSSQSFFYEAKTVFHPQTNKISYAMKKGDTTVVIQQGKEGIVNYNCSSLFFSSDGERYACRAEIEKREDLEKEMGLLWGKKNNCLIIVDGEIDKIYDCNFYSSPERVIFSLDGKKVAYEVLELNEEGGMAGFTYFVVDGERQSKENEYDIYQEGFFAGFSPDGNIFVYNLASYFSGSNNHFIINDTISMKDCSWAGNPGWEEDRFVYNAICNNKIKKIVEDFKENYFEVSEIKE